MKAGAKAAVGFKDSIDCDKANEWTESFFHYYEQGKTVEEAADTADNESGLDSYIAFSQ